MYSVSIIYDVHGNNGRVKSTRNSIKIMLQCVSFKIKTSSTIVGYCTQYLYLSIFSFLLSAGCHINNLSCLCLLI